MVFQSAHGIPRDAAPDQRTEGKRRRVARDAMGLPAGEADSCQQACQHCHEVCRKTVFDMDMGPAAAIHANADDIRLLFECSEICQLSANWQLAGSQYCRQLCVICAQVCRECESRCAGKLDLDECERACRHCAESCEAMSVM